MESVTKVVDNIYQVRVPVPFPLKDVNCYLVRDDQGWVMIDTGLQYGPAYEAWEDAFRQLQLSVHDIRRIYITHAHPDHYGLAGYFQSLSSAPVYMLDKEIRVAPVEWQPDGEHLLALEPFLLQHGTPKQLAEEITSRSLQVLAMVNPQPQLTALTQGEQVTLAGQPYRVLWMPGHADGHMVLYGMKDGILFLGDHVLTRITPNIALWPELDPNPLGSYLSSLDRTEVLEIRLALPGHRATIEDLAGRVAELRIHHATRADACFEAAATGSSAFEVCRRLFPGLERVDDLRMAMVETIAHLEYLVFEGRVDRMQGREIVYAQPNLENAPSHSS